MGNVTSRFNDKRKNISRRDYIADPVEHHTRRRKYVAPNEVEEEIIQQQEQEQIEEDSGEYSDIAYDQESDFLSHANLSMPTVNARYDDEQLRVSKNYQQYLALSITTIAILGITSYKMSNK